MRNYIVEYTEIGYYKVAIEANSEDEAKEILMSGEFPNMPDSFNVEFGEITWVELEGVGVE